MEGETGLRRTATLGAIASVAIVIGIIVVVWLVFFRNSGNENNGRQAQGDNSSNQQAQGNQSGSGNAEENSNNSGSGNSSNGSTSGGSSSSNNQGKTMPNSGPKENALVFAGTAVAATGVYYVYTRRKLANN